MSKTFAFFIIYIWKLYSKIIHQHGLRSNWDSHYNGLPVYLLHRSTIILPFKTVHREHECGHFKHNALQPDYTLTNYVVPIKLTRIHFNWFAIFSNRNLTTYRTLQVAGLLQILQIRSEQSRSNFNLVLYSLVLVHEESIWYQDGGANLTHCFPTPKHNMDSILPSYVRVSFTLTVVRMSF